MKKRVVVLIVLTALLFVVLVYARFDSGKVILNDDKVNSAGKIITTENLSVGDVFYLEDGRKARVTGVSEVDDNSNFDNLNFFANGVLVHNKFEDFKAALNWEPTRDVQEVLRYNREQRIAYLKEIFGEENIVGREDAIWEAHLTPILKDKLRILQRAGFNQVQRRMILKAGICGEWILKQLILF